MDILLLIPVVEALQPLIVTHHFSVPGVRFGPEIPLDHPLRRELQGKEGGALHGQGASSSSPGTDSATAITVLGNVALTTNTGTVANVHGEPVGTSKTLPIGTSVYGPHEAGFGPNQDAVITSQMGCATPSLCYSSGGIDTKLAEAECAYACGISLPRAQWGTYYGFLDDCGGHTNYHFHRDLSCLYSDGPGHSPKLAEGTDTAATPLYGKWEDFTTSTLPLLDACGGHFGITPDSAGTSVYHNHVQDGPPFTYGCYGPSDDDSLVTVEQCRALYPAYCDGVLSTHTTAAGAIQYDAYCPCYDGSRLGHDGAGLNTGVGIVPLPATVAPPPPLPPASPGGYSPPPPPAPPSPAPLAPGAAVATSAPTAAPTASSTALVTMEGAFNCSACECSSLAPHRIMCACVASVASFTCIAMVARTFEDG